MAYVIIAAYSFQPFTELGYESRSFLSEELNDRASSNPRLYFPSSLSARKESAPAPLISEKAAAGPMVLDTVGALEGKMRVDALTTTTHVMWIPVRTPTREEVHPELLCKIEDGPEADEGIISRNRYDQYTPLGMADILATWFGDGFFLVDLLFVASLGRAGRILFDPMIKHREDIPEIDIVVISHNHYDGLDKHTLSTLFKRTRAPHIFAPLGTEKYFEWIGTLGEHTHIFYWWDAGRLEIHGTFVDGEGKKVYFAGDPVILGDWVRFDGFDLAVIHIGRTSEGGSVLLYIALRNIAYVSSRISWRRRRSQCIGEEITQSLKKLAEELKKIGIDNSHFLVSDIGEKYF
ncbi:hypothetical protein EDD85DRAFT_957434 [Armillaria nabsnona]|nr:hypothetical protein EDD85DRAFT_957434 [Armillaria nabsnona]